MPAQYEKQFLDFLKSHKSEKNCEFTHTSMKGGSYYICNSHFDRFMDLYIMALSEGLNLSITEKHKIFSPIVIDLDFRSKIIDNPNMVHLYNDQHIVSIINELYIACKEYLDIGVNFEAYVLEKPPRIHKDYVKDGIHIIFPNIVTTSPFQYYLRERTFDKIGDILQNCKYTNCASDIYDIAAIEKNNWMMYGSQKPDEDNPWLVSKIVTIENDNVVLKNFTVGNKDFKTLVPLLSIRNKCIVTKFIKEFDESAYIYNSNSDNNDVDADNPINNQNYLKVVHDRDYIQNLVNLLAVKRADNRDDWMRVGWCLHNIDIDLFDVWDNFSKKSSKYTIGECEKLWKDMKFSTLGIGTLIYWVKQDSPQEYTKLNSTTLYSFLMKSLSQTNFDVACYIYQKYKHEYACVKVNSKMTCYRFFNHRWVVDDDFTSLYIKMSVEVAEDYKTQAQYFELKASQTNDDQQSKDFLNKSKIFHAIHSDLKNTASKHKFMKECGTLFCKDISFFQNLDTNFDVIGFNNGVYDFTIETFRDGCPDDMITFSTGYDFPKERKDDVVDYIIKFINDISSSPDVASYLIKLLSYTCHGKKSNHSCNLNFWSGIGSNGKSLFKKLCMLTFGNYAYEPDPSIITCPKNDGSKPCPELASLKGKRFVALSEPENQQKLQVSLLKRMSGGDKIQARALYKDNIEFDLQCILVILMNNKPSLNDFDNGICRRLSIVEFPYKFVENPVLPNEKKMDMQLDDLFERNIEYRQQFMLLLLCYHHQYRGSVTKPYEVIKDTEEYLADNNVIKTYMEHRINITNNNDNCISAQELYNDFKHSDLFNAKDNRWFKEQLKINGLVSKKKTTRGIHYNCMVYFGVQFKDSNDLNQDLEDF